jgi:hypothetical protein
MIPDIEPLDNLTRDVFPLAAVSVAAQATRIKIVKSFFTQPPLFSTLDYNYKFLNDPVNQISLIRSYAQVS